MFLRNEKLTTAIVQGCLPKSLDCECQRQRRRAVRKAKRMELRLGARRTLRQSELTRHETPKVAEPPLTAVTTLPKPSRNPGPNWKVVCQDRQHSKPPQQAIRDTHRLAGGIVRIRVGKHREYPCSNVKKLYGPLGTLTPLLSLLKPSLGDEMAWLKEAAV